MFTQRRPLYSASFCGKLVAVKSNDTRASEDDMKRVTRREAVEAFTEAAYGERLTFESP